MEDNQTSGLWKWLVGLLVVCNFALIAIIWFRPQPQFPYQGGGMGMMPKQHLGPHNLDTKLDLTKDQEVKFQQLSSVQRIKIDSIKQLAKKTREQFFASISATEQNQAQLEQMSTELGNYHKSIEQLTYSYFREVRSILNDKQKAVFDGLIIDILTKMPEQPHMKDDGGSGRPDGPPGDHNCPPDEHNGPKGAGSDDRNGPPQ